MSRTPARPEPRRATPDDLPPTGRGRRGDTTASRNRRYRDSCQLSVLRYGEARTVEIMRRLRGGEIAGWTGGRDGSVATQRRRWAGKKAGGGTGRRTQSTANEPCTLTPGEGAAPATRRKRGRKVGGNHDQRGENPGVGQTEGRFRGVFTLFSEGVNRCP